MRDGRAVSRTISSSDGPVSVCYDAECGICSASADLLRRVDRVGRLRLVPLQAAPDIPTVAAVGASSELRTGLHVISADGTFAAGAEALLRLCDALPPLRPFAWLGRLPFLHPFVERLYSLVAANRRRVSGLVGHPRWARGDRS